LKVYQKRKEKMEFPEHINECFEFQFDNFNKFPEENNGQWIVNSGYKNYFINDLKDIIEKLDLRYSQIKKMKSLYEEYDNIKVYYYTKTIGNYYTFYWKIFLNNDKTVIKGSVKKIYTLQSDFTYYFDGWKENEDRIKQELQDELEELEEQEKIEEKILKKRLKHRKIDFIIN
jgi:hypothetical protein